MKSQELTQKIQDALVFASREDYRHLPMIRGLGAMIRVQLASLKQASGTGSEICVNLEALFKGFDDCELAQKKDLIDQALRILTREATPQKKSQKPPVAKAVLWEARAALTQAHAVLAAPVTAVKGIGPRTQKLLEIKGIRCIRDLLFFVPRRYEDRRTITRIADTVPGQVYIMIGSIINFGVKWYGRKKLFEASIQDGSGVLLAKWFKGNERYLRSQLVKGKEMLLMAEVRGWGGAREVIHPEFEIFDPEEERNQGEQLHFGRIVPIYSETEGLHQKIIRKIIREAVNKNLHAIVDTLPEEIRRRQGLSTLGDAVREIHFPEETDCFTEDGKVCSNALRTLVFDEFFYFQLAMALRARGTLKEQGIAFDTTGNLMSRFHENLSFSLTGAQRRVIETILQDMRQPHPMNRLVHGDVGCGKTVVAMSAMVTACENGWQCVMMAPTEILAEQHFRQVGRWAEALGLKAALLTGKLKSAERARVNRDIREGSIDIVVGTQALIQDGVAFRRLGLAVIDEQHRFGVMQRATLRQKGLNPDILFMTATPIPRTLAMTVYGDLEVSMIDEMPPGKKEILSKIFRERQRSTVYEVIRNEIGKGHQIYVVYPLVEASEKLDLRDATRMGETLKREVFPQCRVEVLHGQMRPEVKDQIMNDFAAGVIQILVSTTVVEVGIDVPNATLMVVEHAERFGLSQLHQLRGRVGRSDIQSYFILMTGNSQTDVATRRLRVIEKTSDGFLIAEEDLAIRGAGEFLGVKQSGLPEFLVGNIVRDQEILNDARTEAFALVDEDPDMIRPDHAILLDILRERWGDRLKFLEAG